MFEPKGIEHRILVCCVLLKTDCVWCQLVRIKIGLTCIYIDMPIDEESAQLVIGILQQIIAAPQHYFHLKLI